MNKAEIFYKDIGDYLSRSGSIVSSRDAWCYNFSKNELQKNIKRIYLENNLDKFLGNRIL